MKGLLRLAIVGCGDIARYMALFARLNPRIRLAACCDHKPEQAAAFSRRFAIPHVHTDYRALFAQEAVDAVYLAVPHDLHFEILQSAIQAGLPALVEKPLTRTLAEGQEILRLAQAAQVKVGVNYQYRYDTGCYALAMAARRGDLGRLYFGRCNVPWQRTEDYFEQGAWRGRLAQAGGGTLLTQGSHALDILLWALDSSPRAAQGLARQQRFTGVEVEDLALGMLELESGAVLQISSTMLANPEQAIRIEIYGEKGSAVYCDKPWPRATFRGVKVKKASPPVRGLHALQRSLEAFRQWVMDGQPYLVPAAAALPALAAVDAIYRSACSGKKEYTDDR